MPEPLVLERITKRYGRGAPVLNGLSHTFEPGTATGLVGPNGSGKTTLLRLLSTEAFPTEGSVTYGTLNVHEHPYRYLRHVGLVHAEAALPQYLSAVELLEWILRSRERWDEKAPHRIAQLLDRLMLDERREQLIGTYSSGMLGKTQLAAALVHDPEVILADEPFRSLDAATTKAALQLLREHKARGAVLIVASHQSRSLDALVDAYMHLGPQPEPEEERGRVGERELG